MADQAARLAGATLPLDLKRQIELTLTELARLLDADRCLLVAGAVAARSAWVFSEADTAAGRWPDGMNFASAFPWHFARICGASTPAIAVRLDEVPKNAEDWQSARVLGVRSMLTLAVQDDQGHSRCLVIQSCREAAWSSIDLAVLGSLTRAVVGAWSRRQLEEARQVEAQHVDVLESVGVMLWRADVRTFQTTFVSREVETILGYPAEMWLEIPGFWRSHIHPDDREWVEVFTARAIQRHQAHDFEYRMLVANDRTVWLRNIVKVIVRDGEPVALVGASVDVTERKRAELEIAQLREELMHAGRVTTVGTLAATLAHELNQPLGAMVSNAETALLEAAKAPRASEALQNILHDIARDAERAGEIVHRVRMLLQRQPVEAQLLDLHRVVNAVTELVLPVAMSRGIEVVLQLDPAMQLQGDVVQIQQLFLNLLLNAIDAMTDMPAGARQITVRGVERGAEAELSVIDTGRGLPAEALARAFEPFFTTRSGGLGMGLAICKTIVEAHGGRIWIENTAGGGAAVRFTLRAIGGAAESRGR